MFRESKRHALAKKRGTISITLELRDLMHAAPFRPFRIKTTDGDTFTVDHPDFIMISRRGDTAVLYPKETPDEGHKVLNLRHIVSTKPITNGSRKPGRR